MPPPLDGSRQGWPGHRAGYDRCGDFGQNCQGTIRIISVIEDPADFSKERPPDPLSFPARIAIPCFSMHNIP